MNPLFKVWHFRNDIVISPYWPGNQDHLHLTKLYSLKRYFFSYRYRLFALLILLSAGAANAYAQSLTASPLPIIVASDEGDPYQVKEFTMDGPGMLKVFTLNGNIEVETVANSEKVRVELYVDRGYAFWSNTKNLDNYRIIIIQRGTEVVASVEQKTKGAGLFSDQMTFSFKIYIPESMSSELKTSGGHVELRGARGTHTIKTSGGNIDVRNIQGMVRAFTAGGNIDIRSSKGTIFAHTDGGNMNIDDNEGELRLRAKGGWIKAHRISGAMLAQVDGGDIEASFINVSQGISLETTAGDITVFLPGYTGYDISLKGSKVEMDYSESFEGVRRTSIIEGELNKGGATINLITGSGTVTFETEN